MGEIVNQLQDFIVREFVRRKTVDGRLDRRRGDQMRLIAIASGMQDLQRNFPAFFMNGVRDHAVVRQLAGVI